MSSPALEQAIVSSIVIAADWSSSKGAIVAFTATELEHPLSSKANIS